MAGDRQFSCGVWQLAEAYSRAGHAVYMYHFTQRSSVSPWPPYMGALHGDEILFVFGVPLAQRGRYTGPEVQLSCKMMRYWANFAKTGGVLWTPIVSQWE